MFINLSCSFLMYIAYLIRRSILLLSLSKEAVAKTSTIISKVLRLFFDEFLYF